jgi:hypothetical protein
LRELQEPRPAGQECIPWLGETAMKERVLRLCARGKIAINVRGMEFLQTQSGEDEDAAWKRLRPKLPFTGRQLEEVFVLVPTAVPTTGGTTQPETPEPPSSGDGGNNNNGNSNGDDLFGGDQTPTLPGNNTTEGNGGTTTGTTTPQPGGGIFGGDTSTTNKPRIALSNAATSPLNLIGKLEGWGIGPATPVTEVTIKVTTATGAQIKELLKKLPEGMAFHLSLEKDAN